MPPIGTSGLPWRWHLRLQAHAARVYHPWRRNRSPVAAQRAGGGNPGQDDPDATSVLGLDPRAGDGHQPWIIQRAGPGRRPCQERRGRVGRSGPGRPGAGRCGCPERPSPSSGITLSDEGRQEGRKRTRRLALIRSGAQIGSIWQAKISCGVSAAATRNPDGRDPRSFIQNKYCQRTGPTSGPSSGLYRP